MLFPNDIKLRKVGEPEPNSLPRGVVLVVIDGKPVFVRRSMGRFMPLPEIEQEELYKKHIT